MKEEWKTIKYFPGYKVSSYGRVKSIKRTIIKSDGRLQSVKTRLLSLCHNSRGYLNVRLYKKGEFKTKKVHRLVGEAFITNSENKPEINHKNAVKDDNRVENLEYVTRSENAHHASVFGLYNPCQGEDVYSSLLTNKQVGSIRELLKQGQLNQREVGEIFGVRRQLISSINTGNIYKNV